jgi:hypothetical protein
MLYKIKEDLDSKYGFDISTRNRKRKYAYSRKVFCKLAKSRIEEYTLTEIGEVLNLTHDNVIYMLSTFNYINKTDLKIFNELSDKYLGTNLLNEQKAIEQSDIIKSIPKLSSFEKLLELTDHDLLEFEETRLKPFIKMLESRKKKLINTCQIK